MELIADRFPAPKPKSNDVRFAVINEIARQASEAWGMGCAQVAFDYMKVGIPVPPVAAIDVADGQISDGGGRVFPM